MKLLIMGDDLRYRELAQMLVDQELDVTHVNDWTAFCKWNESGVSVDLLFLPIGPVPDDDNLTLPSNIQLVWSGSRQRLSNPHHIPIFTYTEDEDWLWKNADLTAECMLKWAYIHLSNKLSSYIWDISGYGRVAKTLAKKLQGLGAFVQIRSRSRRQQAEARQDGFLSLDLDAQVPSGALVINTIPAPWLSKAQSAPAETVVDLASVPGGLTEQIEVPYHHLLSLPGKVFPRDAAREFMSLLERKGIISGKS